MTQFSRKVTVLWHNVASSFLIDNTAHNNRIWTEIWVYVSSEYLLVSKTLLFVQLVKTEKNKIIKTFVALH